MKKLILIVTFVLYSSTAHALTMQPLADTATNPSTTDSTQQKNYSGLTDNDLNEDVETVESTNKLTISNPLSIKPTGTNDLSSGIESTNPKWLALLLLDVRKLDGTLTGSNQFIGHTSQVQTYRSLR